MDLAVVLSGEALGRISSEILASSTRSEAPLLRNEDRVEGAGTSGQGPEAPAWRRVTPTERISRAGGAAAPGQSQVLVQAEVARAGARARG